MELVLLVKPHLSSRLGVRVRIAKYRNRVFSTCQLETRPSKSDSFPRRVETSPGRWENRRRNVYEACLQGSQPSARRFRVLRIDSAYLARKSRSKGKPHWRFSRLGSSCPIVSSPRDVNLHRDNGHVGFFFVSILGACRRPKGKMKARGGGAKRSGEKRMQRENDERGEKWGRGTRKLARHEGR